MENFVLSSLILVVMYNTIFVINIIFFTCVCNILMFCEFKIAVILFLRERICSQ